MPEQFHIYVVDDDPSFGDSMRRLLKSHGYSVSLFRSAAEFLGASQLSDNACLIADIHMPGMTGVELYVAVRKTGRTIPTILITAYPEETVRQRMLDLGVISYLNKPLNEAVLIDCLRHALACNLAKRAPR
ncbi:response regulator [Massilia sp. RP-1-19]|uniref:Response regulator n=1 Tax=Massilia polaris TaxID=2728846 RepID=A0A848HM86_9BURK|nr:response regulator [Massilia polaris]